MSRNFNGSTGWLSVGNTTPLNIFGAGVGLTVAAWIRPSRVNVVQVAAGRWTTGQLQYLLYVSATAKLTALVHNNNSSIGTATSTASISTTPWTHVAMVHDNSNVYAFINGVQDGSGAANFARVTTSGSFEIGSNDGGTNKFGGKIAEVGVWATSTMTSAEVLALAKGLSPSRLRPNTLKGYWPVWGNASPEADLTGNKQNATLTGTANQDDHAPVGRLLEQA